MKLLLLLAIYCVLVQGQVKRVRNDSCLKRNWYKHESACHGPRRYFYAFHRILFDCIQVTTNCPRMYKENEYVSRGECRSDCYYHMQVPVFPKKDPEKADKSTIDKPNSDKPNSDKPNSDKPNSDKPKYDQSDLGTDELPNAS